MEECVNIGINVSLISDCILVGALNRIPRLTEALSRYFEINQSLEKDTDLENENDALVTRGCAIVCAVDQELGMEPLSIELLPFSILMEDSCFIDENGVNFGYLMDNVDLSKQLKQQRKKEKKEKRDKNDRKEQDILVVTPKANNNSNNNNNNNNNNLNTPRESNLTKMLLRNDGEHYNKNVDTISSNGINSKNVSKSINENGMIVSHRKSSILESDPHLLNLNYLGYLTPVIKAHCACPCKRTITKQTYYDNQTGLYSECICFIQVFFLLCFLF